MRVGTVKESKGGENRVGLTPQGVRTLVEAGQEMYIETGAGINSGFPDEDYRQAGAKVLPRAREVFDRCQMIVKVKEPLPPEFDFLHPGQILFTFLHLAAEERLTRELLERRVTAIGYETVELPDGSLPILTPMSEIAGRMAVLVGAHYLQRNQGGYGKLITGVPGVPKGKVVILGSGVVGSNAAKIAVALGAQVTVIGTKLPQLRYLENILHGDVMTLISDSYNIEAAVMEADLLIGAVLITGAKAPKLVSRSLVRKMRPGSVIVDVSIDQGGCMETSHPTTHQNPIYMEEGVLHYCVTNMPGAVPYTSTLALTSVSTPYVLEIASRGLEEALSSNPALAKGVNTFAGKATCPGVAEALGLKYEPL